MGMDWKDYYKTLGVARGASAAEVKRAYRAAARQFHPDRNTSPAAEARFKEINEANEVLSDPHRRAEYDALGPDPERIMRERAGPQSPFRQGSPVYRSGPASVRYEFHGAPAEDFSEFFRAFFGPELDWEPEPIPPVRERSRSDIPSPRPAVQRPRSRSVEVSLIEAERGAVKPLTIAGKHLEVKIPPGVETGSKIRLSGVGAVGADVVLVMRVAEHPLFARDGADLSVELPITLAEALLGAEVPLETLRGRLLVKIPAGMQSGSVLRLAGQGMPVLRASRRGDLLVRIKVILPGRLDDRTRRAAADFLALIPQPSPRAK
jgi:curved DNA-binding protein